MVCLQKANQNRSKTFYPRKYVCCCIVLSFFCHYNFNIERDREMELIQVRVDEETKAAASALFEALGMDTSTAIRSFLKKAIAEGGMPFEMKLDESTREAIIAVKAMRETSKKNGNSEMSLDEINQEIAQARKERRVKN